MTEAKDISRINQRIARKWAGLNASTFQLEEVARVRHLTLADLDRELADEMGSDASGYTENHVAVIYNAAGELVRQISVGVYYQDNRRPQNTRGEVFGAVLAEYRRGEVVATGEHLIVFESGSPSATGSEEWERTTIYPLDEHAGELVRAWAAAQDGLGDRLALPAPGAEPEVTPYEKQSEQMPAFWFITSPRQSPQADGRCGHGYTAPLLLTLAMLARNLFRRPATRAYWRRYDPQWFASDDSYEPARIVKLVAAGTHGIEDVVRLPGRLIAAEMKISGWLRR
ncbi:MAG: hypothetical protein GY719_25745 [bacterium]|nr:hypothetical protein [bacterium]